MDACGRDRKIVAKERLLGKEMGSAQSMVGCLWFEVAREGWVPGFTVLEVGTDMRCVCRGYVWEGNGGELE